MFLIISRSSIFGVWNMAWKCDPVQHMDKIGVWAWAKKVDCWLGDKVDVYDDQGLEWDSEKRRRELAMKEQKCEVEREHVKQKVELCREKECVKQRI